MVAHDGKARMKTTMFLRIMATIIDHNFGHGQEYLVYHLADVEFARFSLHTIAQIADEVYQQVRRALGARRTFFNDAGSFDALFDIPRLALDAQIHVCPT